MDRFVSALLAAMICFRLALGVHAQTASSLGVGIVRPDGRLIPFAAYADGQWEQAWPGAEESDDPASIEKATPGQLPAIDDVPSFWNGRGEPVPRTWFVRRLSRPDPIATQVTRTAIFETHCSGQIALATDLAPKPPQFWRRIGVAVTDSSVQVSIVNEVLPADPAWNGVSTLVIKQFERLEREHVHISGPPLIRDATPPPIKIRRLYRSAGAAVSPMYFEAQRSYAAPRYAGEPQCPAVTVLTGWIMVAANGDFTLVAPVVYLTECEQKSVRRAAPLAALQVGASLFWVLQTAGYEDLRYVVARLRSSSVEFVVDVDAGGC